MSAWNYRRYRYCRFLASAGSRSVVRRCTYPSIHFFVSRSRSVAWRVHIQAFTLKLSRSRSVARRAHIQAFATKRVVVQSSKRTATRSSPHARRPSIVDTSKNKSANSGKRDDWTCVPLYQKKKKPTSVISKKKKKRPRERIYLHYGYN